MHVSKIQGKAGWWRQGQDLDLWQCIRVCCSFWQWVTRAPGCTELPADLSPSLPPRQQKDERRDTSLSSLPVLGSFQSLPAQKTMASSDQPLRRQKLLAWHSRSQSRARPAPHTEEGKSATPEHNSEPSTERTLVLSENSPEGKEYQAPVLHSPDRTHHSKVCFRVPSLPSQAHIQLFLWWCHPLQHYQPSLLCYETSNLSTATCIDVDRLQSPFGVSEGHVET